MKRMVVIVAVVVSLLPASASASTSDLSNFTATCELQADGGSVVRGSFDLATGEATSLQERGYAHSEQWVRGRHYSYTRVTYFGPAWTITPTARGSHYTFAFPEVGAYLTSARMPQGAILYLDAASFKSYAYSPPIPITLTYYTGHCSGSAAAPTSSPATSGTATLALPDPSSDSISVSEDSGEASY